MDDLFDSIATLLERNLQQPMHDLDDSIASFVGAELVTTNALQQTLKKQKGGGVCFGVV